MRYATAFAMLSLFGCPPDPKTSEVYDKCIRYVTDNHLDAAQCSADAAVQSGDAGPVGR